MGMPKFTALIIALLLPLHAFAAGLTWEGWSDEVFARAKKEKRFVILDLEAVWCHWCHVMEEKTYAIDKVQALIKDKFIPVRVDQDARPDLSNRYENYGWPATVVFAADGSEIVKRRGYISPEEMVAMLEAIIADPTPGPSVQPVKDLTFNAAGTLSSELRNQFEIALKDLYDNEMGAWGRGQKYLDWDNVEWSLRRALGGDKSAEKRAKQTITNERKLVDPVWGGVYQYSTDNDWDHAHFEKIMIVQAENMHIASLAFAQWHDARDLATAQSIQRYVKDFLTSPDGAFYTSQDADLVPGEHSGEYFALDDAARRAKGMPRVDQHIYTRENAWMIHSLAVLHGLSGDETALADAKRAAEWIVLHRNRTEGGFHHGEKDEALYFGDQVYLLRAFLSLLMTTRDNVWLERAEQLAAFIAPRFKSAKAPDAGFASTDAGPTDYYQADENITLTRSANELFHITGKEMYHQMALRAMRYLATPEVAEGRFSSVGGFLLADDEMRRAPLHVTIVGKRDDAAAAKLYLAALQHPTSYKRLDWYDPSGPKPANLDIEFPLVKSASAFVCGDGSCSRPVTEPEALRQLMLR